ncbi:AQG_2a_G0041730.mRNA.1.CDS.1 [Saccharomyces cerevisiae]|uniref:K7_Vba1p n=7 Tax=Saccharomyces TaxID=4930 RepID=G2WKD6_YEASK|nr:Vba1p [Saccharomyces cerevisiae YJM1078]AJS62828.1 Vba1p [Saccharomyces cerevisiae YJM195]AJS63263.1 Vba1p [Saccharomyces cerevisiae YJM244]AJS63700.1 Vba1p [Saccharomyces cerevisiae YJM248]AJS64137.1 Vba1p [Saccharomyces cerevisiae YJM270]AJS64572.1 Vba1p [Saccharomyces cerevisiae YJM271]AJS65006.1 Vba1p [Saccharomyces cerevisiae YJM320]AJS65878.1 Vba1p [Saccharomyces cerevisiae YJM428]AJS66315.1 Vba1p [Saccharomyces cerevisiae YJM450]AJS66755.1 Vba1p [Saccharomyces cerevisiae YJM451]
MQTLDETSNLLPPPEEAEAPPLEQKFHEYNLALPKFPILFSLWLGSFLSSLDSTIVANIMNRVAEEFSESSKKQWIATSFLLTNTAFQPLYGKLSDITGRKSALLTAQFFFGLGCLLTCFARNVTEFSIARAICGIGAGGLNAISSIAVSDICTARERGVYQGYANIVFGFGQLLGAPLGGVFIETIGWRALFGIQVPVIMLCSVLAIKNINIKLFHVPPMKERYTLKNLSRIDIFGSLSLVATISGVLFLCSSQLNKLYLALFTIGSFIVFILVERYYATEKILPFELLTRSFCLSSAVTVISSFVVFGEIFRSPIYLQLLQNISVTKTGLFLIFPSISVAVGSLVTGWVLRNTKINLAHCAYQIIFGGMIMQLLGLGLGYLLLSHLNPDYTIYDMLESITFRSNSIWWKLIYVFASVLVSFGYACLLVATLVSIVFTVEKSQQGTMTGVFYLWRSIGNVLGASLTLVSYENSLSSMLWNYMFKTKRDDEYHFTKKQYYSLINDSSYLRGPNFPTDIFVRILDVYKKAFLISYIPNIALAAVGIVLSLYLVKHTYKRSSSS